jgi:predicted CXXCH cytochrome family protein
MKTGKLIFTASKLALAAGLLMTAGGVLAAGITDTKHNLGTTPGANQVNIYSGTAEICVFCHTPHGADTSASVPLWNKNLSNPSIYTTYDTLGTSTLDGATAPVGSVSLACLSCHDGTQAMDTVLNAPGSGATVASYSAGTWTGPAASTSPVGAITNSIVNLGTDLTNDHPVGIQYGGGNLKESTPSLGANATKDPDFKTASFAPINGNPIWWVDTEVAPNGTRQKTDMQLYTRTVASIDGGEKQPFVECASCHDPHTENVTFLRISNDGSAVCLACHIK